MEFIYRAFRICINISYIFYNVDTLMTEVDPFLDVSPQNSRLEVMIFATFLFALINEYEGVEF